MSEHLERRLAAITYHAPSVLCSSSQVFVCLLDKEIPECREKLLMFAMFKETMMWATKALSKPGA